MADVTDFLPLRRESIATIRPRVDNDANAGVDPYSDRYLDTTAGGFLWDLTQAVLLEVERLWDLASTEVPAIAFPTYAWGEYLDSHGGVLQLPRKTAAKATGAATFSGTVGVTVPVGTQVSTVALDPEVDPVIVQTTQAVNIAAGGSVSIPVVAVEEGAASNVAAYALSEFVTPVDGVTAVANPAALSGGAEVESDEAYKARLALQFAAVQGAGTVSDYERWTLEFAGVGAVQVDPVWAGEGTVRVVALDASGNAISQTLVNTIQGVLDPPSASANIGVQQQLPVASLLVDDASGFRDTGRVFAGGSAVTYTGRSQKIATPVIASATPSTTGGTLAAGVYYYRLTALNALGETIGSTEVTATTTGSTGRVTVTWTAVTGATGYRLYRGVASSAQDRYIAVGAVTSATDIGSGYTTAAPPVYGSTAALTGAVNGTALLTPGARVIQGGQGRGRAPIGAEVLVVTASTTLVTVAGFVTHRPGYSLDGTAGTAATRAAILQALSDYIDGAKPGEAIVRNHVEAQFFTVPGVYDVTGVTINGVPADLTIGPSASAQMARDSGGNLYANLA